MLLLDTKISVTLDSTHSFSIVFKNYQKLINSFLQYLFKGCLIYYIDLQALLDKQLMNEYIYPNMELNYYWSDSFDETFYVKLAQAGFIATSMYDTNDNAILLPEIQFDYAVLHFEDLHVSTKVCKLLTQQNYIFSINTQLYDVIEKIDAYHELSWLTCEYKKMLLQLSHNHYDNFELLSIELNDKSTNELIAAEIGYKIGHTYTSLTGFFKKEKAYNNWGKLQLVLLGRYLQENGYHFWNLGHASLQYKIDLGAKVYSREDFLKLWFSSSSVSHLT